MLERKRIGTMWRVRRGIWKLNVYLCAYKEITGHSLQIERVQNGIIRQHNNRDCGALVCKFIEAIVLQGSHRGNNCWREQKLCGRRGKPNQR